MVIAIIAILAAIPFRVFAKARENARKSTCQSNLKQIGIACRMYAQDYDGRMPNNWKDCTPGPAAYDWMEVTQPYVKNTGVYNCPSIDSAVADCSWQTLGRSGKGWWGGYAANAGHADPAGLGSVGNGPFGCGAWRPSPKEAIFQKPAETVLVLESTYPCRMSCGAGHAGTDSGSRTGWDSRRTSHMDGMNVLWLDGHVKFHKRQFRPEEFGTD